MSDPVASKPEGDALDVKGDEATPQVEHYPNLDLDEKAKAADFKADAVEAENAEHSMTVMEAVRAYPMASFWAFVMSFTIVTGPSPHSEEESQLMHL